MKVLSVALVGILYLGAWNLCRAQCQQSGNLVCGQPGDPTSGAGEQVTVNMTSIPSSAYPIDTYFYPQLSPSVQGWTSQSTIAQPGGGSYGGMAGISMEGTGATMVVHYQFTQISNGQMVLMGQCPAVTIHTDALEQAAFNWSLEAVDCNAGTFRLVLTDNATDPGDLTYPALAAAASYQLNRNGNIVGSGTLSSLAATNPPSFVLNGLTSGSYQLTLTDNSASDGYVYCPSSHSSTFILPNAGDCGVNVALRAALQGALPSGTVMTDGLRAANLVPTTEPYSGLGYAYAGSSAGVTIPASMLAVTGNDAIEDWVVVELRNPTTPALVVYSRAALIQRDGDVVGTDGDPYVSFPVAIGSYHVALRHRNHLGVMTGSARQLGTGMATVLDFRTTTTACYGTAPRAQVGSVLCLWAGDATGNGAVKYTGSGNDRDPILIAVGSTTPNHTLTNVYDRRDTNLDGVIKYTGTGNDRDIILTNVGSTTPNNTRTQQLQ